MVNTSISRSVAWQLIGKFFLQGVAFFTTPIFTRLLTPSDYGYVALYNSWLSMVTLFIGLEVGGSIANARIRYQIENPFKYLSSILTISSISFFVFLFVGIFFKDVLSSILKLRQDLVILLIVHSYATFVISFLVIKYDAFKQVEKSAILSLLQSIVVVICSLLFVFYGKGHKAESRIYGQAIPTIVMSLIIVFFIYIKGKVFWNSEYNKFCLKLTLPLIAHSIGGVVFSQSDKVMLQYMADDTALGIYSVVYSLCSILTIIYSALNVAWVPFYYDYKNQQNTSQILIHSKRYIKFFTLLCIGFMLLSADVLKIIAPSSYWSGTSIIWILVLSIYFRFLYLFPANHEFYNCKNIIAPIGTVFAASVNIIANYILISKYGVSGAALGTLIANLCLFLFHSFMVKFFVKESFEYSWKFYFPWCVCLLVFVHISPVISNFVIIRWILSFFLGVYIITDIIKHKSFF